MTDLPREQTLVSLLHEPTYPAHLASDLGSGCGALTSSSWDAFDQSCQVRCCDVFLTSAKTLGSPSVSSMTS